MGQSIPELGSPDSKPEFPAPPLNLGKFSQEQKGGRFGGGHKEAGLTRRQLSCVLGFLRAFCFFCL